MLKRNAAIIVGLVAFAIAAFIGSALAASAVEIDAKTDSALKMFYEKVGPAKELSAKAKGILIFPDAIKWVEKDTFIWFGCFERIYKFV